MHPDIGWSLIDENQDCQIFAEKLRECQIDHPIASRYFNACGEFVRALDRCFFIQHEIKRRKNLEESVKSLKETRRKLQEGT